MACHWIIVYHYIPCCCWFLFKFPGLLWTFLYRDWLISTDRLDALQVSGTPGDTATEMGQTWQSTLRWSKSWCSFYLPKSWNGYMPNSWDRISWTTNPVSWTWWVARWAHSERGFFGNPFFRCWCVVKLDHAGYADKDVMVLCYLLVHRGY